VITPLESTEEHSCRSVTVYVSIAVRNSMHLVLYRYCCEGQYSVNIHLKYQKKSGQRI